MATGVVGSDMNALALYMVEKLCQNMMDLAEQRGRNKKTRTRVLRSSGKYIQENNKISLQPIINQLARA